MFGKYEKRCLCSANYSRYLGSWNILQEAKQYIMWLKDKYVTEMLKSRRQTGLLGFIVCIEGVVLAVDDSSSQ